MSPNPYDLSSHGGLPELMREKTDQERHRMALAVKDARIADLLDRAEKAEALLAKWESEIGSVMFADFKDWHENIVDEHPEVARWVITSQRENTEWFADRMNEAIYRAEKAERELAEKIGYIETERLQDAWAETAKVKAQLAEAEEAIRVVQRELNFDDNMSGWVALDFVSRLRNQWVSMPAVRRALARKGEK